MYVGMLTRYLYIWSFKFVISNQYMDGDNGVLICLIINQNETVHSEICNSPDCSYIQYVINVSEVGQKYKLP